MTKPEITADYNLLCSFEYGKFSLYLIYQGTDKLHYVAFLDNDILFEGKDFRPSPMFNIDDPDSVIACIGFLTVQEHDTDPEYFANYTPAQLSYRDSRECYELYNYLADYGNEKFDDLPKKQQHDFLKHFLRY